MIHKQIANYISSLPGFSGVYIYRMDNARDVKLPCIVYTLITGNDIDSDTASEYAQRYTYRFEVYVSDKSTGHDGCVTLVKSLKSAFKTLSSSAFGTPPVRLARCKINSISDNNYAPLDGTYSMYIEITFYIIS